MSHLRAVRGSIVLLLTIACLWPGGRAHAQAASIGGHTTALEQARQRIEADDATGAIASAQQALLIARERRDTARTMEAMYLLMKFNVQARHSEEADRLRRELLDMALAYGKDAKQLAQAHNAVGSMYSRLEQRDSAEHHFRAALRIPGNEEHTLLRQALLGNLASILGETGRHAEAIALHERALDLVDSTDHVNRAWSLNTLAQSLLYAGRYREAIEQLHLADSLNKLGGHRLDLAIDLAELRADCLDSLGDIPGAYAMEKLAGDLRDTLFERSLDEQYTELEKRFGMRLQEEEIASLEAEGRERAERLRRRGLQAIGSAVLAVLAVLVVGLLLRDRRRRRRHTNDLERLNHELKDQQGRIAEINRLLELKVLRARMDPHFIYNSITAIGVLARSGETTAAIAYLDGFARLMRMVLDHGVRDTVTIHEEMDFLRQYLSLENMRFEGGLRSTVQADQVLLDEDVRIPSLLVQPFVENAVWHGLASKSGDRHVGIRFAEEGAGVLAIVEDNGTGRSTAVKRTHPNGSPSLGVRLSDERLQLLTHRFGDQAIRYEDLVHPDGSPAGTRVIIHIG